MPACLLACWYGHLLFFCHQLTGNITEAASLGVLTTGTYTCHRFEFKNNSSHAFLGKLKLVAGPACHFGPLQPYQLRTHRYPSFIIIIIIIVIITTSFSSQAPFQTTRRSRTLLNQRPRRRAPKWRTFPPSQTQTCLLPHILLIRFPFPCNLPFCNKKPCLQPSQYLNNNLGGHRGDIDEVGEQLNILSNPPNRHNVDRCIIILLLRGIITIVTMRNLKAEYLVRSECWICNVPCTPSYQLYHQPSPPSSSPSSPSSPSSSPSSPSSSPSSPVSSTASLFFATIRYQQLQTLWLDSIQLSRQPWNPSNTKVWTSHDKEFEMINARQQHNHDNVLKPGDSNQQHQRNARPSNVQHQKWKRVSSQPTR